MSLDRITISNFKALGSVVQTLPLKPITLIFGANSAGKSSVLHSLLWLRHGITQGELDVQEPFGGQGINLGGFDQLIHGHDRSNTPVIGWSVPGSSIKPGLGGWENLERFDIELGYGRNQSKVDLQTCSVSTLEGLMFRASFRPEAGWKIDTLDWEHPAIHSLLAAGGIHTSDPQASARLARIDHAISAGCYDLETRDFRPSNLDMSGPSEAINSEDRWLLEEAIPGAFARLFEAFRKGIDDRLRNMIFVPPLRDLPTRGMDFRLGGSADWKSLVNHPERESILAKLNEKLSLMKIRYEVHLRRLVAEETMIDRVESKLLDWVTESVASAETQEGNWGAVSCDLENMRMGWEAQAWDAISNKDAWIEAHPEFHQKLIAYWEDVIRGNPDYQDEYFDRYPEADPDQLPPDDWITERAEALIDPDDEIFTDERTRILLSEDPELRATLSTGLNARKLATSLRSVTDPMESRMEVRLRDLQHNVWVSLQDVGVGISQVMPVLISAVIGQHNLIAIEQPEIHIHPALQAELGDVFIESALGENKNTFLLETHSEHMILRILRRIRETTEGDFDDWPEGLRNACPNGIRPTDVAVLYVEPGENGAQVKNLRVNELGEIIDEWPNGFFDERIKEVL